MFYAEETEFFVGFGKTGERGNSALEIVQFSLEMLNCSFVEEISILPFSKRGIDFEKNIIRWKVSMKP